MKAKILVILLIIPILLVVGCGNKQDKINNDGENKEQTVIENQIFEGLEFVNVGINNGVIKTVVINNTGVKYEGSKFSIKIKDENNNIIIELIDEVKEEMETGTTKTIETKTNIDLSQAKIIEYSIVSK